MAGGQAPVRVPGLLRLPLSARSELLRRGQLDPAHYRAVLTSHIRRSDPLVRAFVDWRPADAGHPDLPAAISVTYKDTIDVAGFATRLGIVSGYRRYPERSAYVAARLAGRGLRCAGKVATTECALGSAKPSRNPAYPHLSTAGSSAGSAAAVAAGFCDVSVGSDSGGSVRWPAVYCGTVALRLTPRPELIEGIHVVSPSLESAGLITRTAADLSWLWSQFELAAALGMAPAGPPGRPGRLRVAVSAPPGEPLHPEMGAALRETAAALERDGHQVTRAALPEVWSLRAPAGELLAREARDSYGPVRDQPGVSLGEDTRQAIDRGAEVDDARYAALLRRQAAARELLGALLRDDFDLLVTPLEAGLPDPADGPRGVTLSSRAAPSTHFVLLANIAGLPALAMPVALSAGQAPLGVQVLAAPGADDLLVAAAGTLERLSAAINRSIRQAVLT